MGSLKDPKTWIPHIKPKDCSQKVCNLYCTKWCKYVILPSPPPPPLVKDDSGGATLSPVIIIIISLTGSFLLLMAFYVIISRYCTRNYIESSLLLRREVMNQETRDPEIGVDGGNQEDDDNSNYVPWIVLGKGLDDDLINSITICKYKKGDGLVSCTDCPVCLGEFQENESIRLLPNCSHAFHVYCIDTWLKTHSNCPLCRANVCFEAKDLPPKPPPPPPPPPPGISSELGERDVTLEIREDGRRKIRKSKSMSYLCQNRDSIVRSLFYNQAGEMARQEAQFHGDVGSSENALGGNIKRLNFVNTNHFCMK